MRKAIPLGISDYERLKKEQFYYIDKSMMIYDFLVRKNAVTLITRPRRFGKTINLSMMAEFFDITKDSKELFEDTKIVETQFVSELNQYPTIFVSFAEIKGNKKDIVSSIKKCFLQLYQKYDYVFEHMDKYDSVIFNSIESNLMQIENETLSGISDALSFLMEKLEKYYHKKVMVFIDEYDTPFIEAHVGGFYDDIRGGLSSLLHNALKTSTSLQYAMMSGIQRVAKENIFSDLNNLVVCTVKDREYAQYFGFSEEETKAVLEYYGLTLNDEVKLMYDGYRFGDEEIYNPWSVLNYASRKVLEPYWVNISSNTMIKKAMSSVEHAFDRGYEQLIRTGKLETTVNMDTSFFEIHSTSSLWGLLVNAGYLTIEEIVSVFSGRYVLRIPNLEVRKEFQVLTSYYLNVSDSYLDSLFESIRYGEKDGFIEKYREILLTLPSYHDLKDENSYHMMVLGMCAWLSPRYEIISNREVGSGRCDILLKSKNHQTSYVLEFKYTKDASVDLKALASDAIQQSIKHKYAAGIKGKVVYIGLAHYHTNVEIEWIEKE